jgi:prepilin-type N-terminal cleavage/methylation domain-containing protein
LRQALSDGSLGGGSCRHAASSIFSESVGIARFITPQTIRDRLASEHGFTMIELLLVLQIVGILVMISVPTYLTYRNRAEQGTAQSNVRSAITGAYLWNIDKTGGNGSFAGISRSTLLRELPSADPTIKAVSVNGGAGYCVEGSSGAYSYDYLGGLVTPLGGWRIGVVQGASCLTAVGVAALST